MVSQKNKFIVALFLLATLSCYSQNSKTFYAQQDAELIRNRAILSAGYTELMSAQYATLGLLRSDSIHTVFTMNGVREILTLATDAQTNLDVGVLSSRTYNSNSHVFLIDDDVIYEPHEEAQDASKIARLNPIRSQTNSHADACYTILAGKGNQEDWMGMANPIVHTGEFKEYDYHKPAIDFGCIVSSESWADVGHAKCPKGFYTNYESTLRLANSKELIRVVAAGNEGSPGDGQYYEGTVDGYGTLINMDFNAIIVGAVNSSNVITSFSSKGPAGLTYHTKPDFVALGSNVPVWKRSGGYTTGAGTSYATPALAGGVVLVYDNAKAKGITLNRNSMFAALALFALDLGASQVDYAYGFGKPSIEQTVAAIDSVGSKYHLVNGENAKTFIANSTSVKIAYSQDMVKWQTPNDFFVIHEGNRVNPWELNPDDYLAPATRKKLSYNNRAIINLTASIGDTIVVYSNGIESIFSYMTSGLAATDTTVVPPPPPPPDGDACNYSFIYRIR